MREWGLVILLLRRVEYGMSDVARCLVLCVTVTATQKRNKRYFEGIDGNICTLFDPLLSQRMVSPHPTSLFLRIDDRMACDAVDENRR